MWRLKCAEGGSIGRQVWHYDANASADLVLEQEKSRKQYLEDREKTGRQNSGDCLWRVQCQDEWKDKLKEWGLDSNEPRKRSVREGLIDGIRFYQTLQMDDGHWPGDYGGPMFLMPGLLITCYVTGVQLPEQHKKEMIRYIKTHQNKDGGWGLHIEDKSTIFGTSMQYVSLRLLGVEPTDPSMVKGRDFLHTHGGAVGIPSWGKFWLAALGVYDWEGLNPVSPEMWLSPYFLPVNPGRMWCHCRVVYLPMAYIYGRRATPPITPLLEQLRAELYTTPYAEINWPSHRNNISPLDLYTPHNWLLKIGNKVLGWYEKVRSKWLREKALAECIDHIHHEDQTTKYIDIGPVNKVINMLSVYYDCGPDSEQFKKHKDRLFDYLWVAEDGMKMQGYNGSQLWDTAFATQAILTAPKDIVEMFPTCLNKAAMYIENTQVKEDVDEAPKYYRHISKGAWPFSTRDHGWPISDCTSEGLKAQLGLRKLPFIADEHKVIDWRLFDAVNVSLSFQNADGGWATYENTRGSIILEMLNPSEVFGDIMIDYSYVECTSASVQALAAFHREFPQHRPTEIRNSINRGLEYIRSIQRSDGSWYGSWGVCFTYACWFGIEALVHAGGESYDTSRAIRSACEFVLSKQSSDGGWGESYLSCVTKEYVQNERRNQIINTAWALLALMNADCPDHAAIDKGISFILSRQNGNGDFPQEEISGVFNRNCMITYTNYRNIFPIWALSMYMSKYGDKKA